MSINRVLAFISTSLPAFRALSYRDFRLYWFGQMASVSGLQMVYLAQGWLIWKLTGSELLLGAVGLCSAIPAVLLTLFGGALADKAELRRLLLLLQSIAALTLFVLATLTITGLVRIWHIFAVAFVFGIIQAFDHPGRQALFPHLVERRELMNAVSLNSTIWPGTKIFGPALAGYIIYKVSEVTHSPLLGAATAFYLASLGFVLFSLFLFLLRVPAYERSRGRDILREIGDGVKFVWEHGTFRFLTGINFLGVFFVVTHVTLMPVFVSEILNGDASMLGSLYAAGGIGSLGGAMIAANLAGFRRRGWLIIGSAAAQAGFVLLFALSPVVFISLLLQLLAGFSHAFFMVCAQSTVQLQVPDSFRGRMMSIWGMNYGVIFPLGQMQMGAVAGFSRAYLSGLLGRYAGAPSTVMLGATVMLVVTSLGFGRFRDLSDQWQEVRSDASLQEVGPPTH